jgi:hypothetical protein
MKLIVAEVVLVIPEECMMLGAVLPKPEGTTFYREALVFVKTRPGTPELVRRRRTKAPTK